MVRSLPMLILPRLTADLLIRAVTRELPNNYPFIVQKEYIEVFVKQWDGPAQTLFTAIAKKVKEATLRVVDVHFGNHGYSRFKQRVS
jgi:hypothetical protein